MRLGSIVAVLLAASSCGVAFDGSEPATTGGPSGSAGVGGAGASGGAAQGGAAQGGGVGGAAQGGGGVGGAAQGGGGMGGSGGAACTDGLEVVAAVADCVKHLMPDPDYCETHVSGSGVGEMDVDESRDSTPGNISRAYLRFDLPPDALGAGAFTLRLVNTGLADADSPGSGAVWQVAPFTRASLFIGPPAPVGGNPLDGDQGSVSLNDVVEWDMPAQVIQGGSVYLSVVGTDDNGVRYWNNNSNAPPKLIVTCGG